MKAFSGIILIHRRRFKNRFGFRWTVFGFYWLKAMEPSVIDLLFKRESQERLLELYVACTVGMLRIVYGHNAMLLRQEWVLRFHLWTKGGVIPTPEPESEPEF